MTLQQLRNMLRVNKHRLDDELEIQAEIQEQISAEVARLNSRMLKAKDDLASTEARITEDLKDSGEKLSVAELGAKVQRHKERKESFGILQAARFDLEEWQGMYDAWKQKGRDLESLGRLFGAQYFVVTSIGRELREDRKAYRADDYERGSTRPQPAEEKPRRRSAID